jgi:DNA-binding GntR family transcriptional regulator
MAGYREIAYHIRRQIKDGALQPGDRLPPSSELVRQFRCSEITVRRACRMLEAEGLVESVARRGRFVSGEGKRLDSKASLITAALRALPPGTVTPSTGILMLQFAVSQATVRRAVRELRTDGELKTLRDGRLARA